MKEYRLNLSGNGDFRSEESIRLLNHSDIVCTNPPYSLFREYVAQLDQHGMDFLILGGQTSISCMDIFSMIQNEKMWWGVSIHSGDREFMVPDDYENRSQSFRVDGQGGKYVKVTGVRWYTNLDYPNRHKPMELVERYDPSRFPDIDNFDAINVDRTCDIPCDYPGVMAAPLTFFDKYCPDQFEIIGLAKTPVGAHLRTKIYPPQVQHNKDGSTETVTHLNRTAAILCEAPSPHNVWYDIDGMVYRALFPRILIRRKNQ